MKATKPSDFEMQVLAVLWHRGPLTVREMLEALPDGKARAYTSVLSVMQVMEKKGLLTRRREGLTDRWQPAVKRETVLGPFLRRMVKHLFGGRPSAVLQQLLSGSELGEDELRALKEMIRDYEERERSKPDATRKRKT